MNKYTIPINHKYIVILHDKGGAEIINLFDNNKTIAIPSKEGRIFVGGQILNFKRLIFSMTYPQIDLSNKVIYSTGGFSIKNLFAVTKNQMLATIRYKYKLQKDNEGNTIFIKKLKGKVNEKKRVRKKRAHKKQPKRKQLRKGPLKKRQTN